MEHGHGYFLAAYGIHLFPENGMYFVKHPPSQGEKNIEACGKLPDVSGPEH
jgi:hypothetical protein